MDSSTALVFLPPPAFLEKKLRAAAIASDGVAGFRYDPLRPIPAELPREVVTSPHVHNNDEKHGEHEDEHSHGWTFDSAKLTEEMFVAGMLRALGPRHLRGSLVLEKNDADYYRRLVRAVRPNILAELSEAALVKTRLGDFDMALEVAAILDGLFPGAPSIAHLKSEITAERERALEKTGLDDLSRAAKKEAEKAARREESRVFFAEIKKLMEDEKSAEALQRVKERLERHPKAWRLWFALGWALRCEKRYTEGIAALQQSLTLLEKRSPNTATPNTAYREAVCEARNELAICFSETGDFHAARAELEKALLLDGENTKIISNMGVVALREGKKDEAARFFRAVLEIDSDDPIARRYLGQ